MKPPEIGVADALALARRISRRIPEGKGGDRESVDAIEPSVAEVVGVASGDQHASRIFKLNGERRIFRFRS